MSWLSRIEEAFAVKEVDVHTYSPLTLAYIGDAVYDLVIRTVVVERANRPPEKLHQKTSSLVKAKTQAMMIEALSDILSEEELAVYKRGRNAKSHTVAKNASLLDYRKATGLEALMGYLYLTENFDRVLYLIKEGLSRLEEEL